MARICWTISFCSWNSFIFFCCWQYLQFLILYCVSELLLNVPNIKKFPSLHFIAVHWGTMILPFLFYFSFYFISSSLHNCGWFPFHFLLSNLWWELESPFIYRYSTLTCIIHPLLKNVHYPSSHFLILPIFFSSFLLLQILVDGWIKKLENASESNIIFCS
jgi:hypothetical protein